MFQFQKIATGFSELKNAWVRGMQSVYPDADDSTSFAYFFYHLGINAAAVGLTVVLAYGITSHPWLWFAGVMSYISLFVPIIFGWHSRDV